MAKLQPFEIGVIFWAGREPRETLAELTALGAGPSDTVAATFLRGEILERLSQPANALAEYEKNLAPALPPDVNRTALTKIMLLAQ